MNVKFSFDKAIVERRGFTLEDVYRTIKKSVHRPRFSLRL